ncbi:MAG: hypothetical protein MI806_19930 [Minwuiales bacterium]|nr:hypothetical protein [Minwuiales bacterium]
MASEDNGVRISATVTDPDGGTRFADETIPFAAGGAPFRLTRPMPATAISFRWTPGDFDFDFHPAPRRRLVLVTEGGLEITVGSGEIRTFRPGDILDIRDTWGRGHRSRALGGRPFRSAFIALDDEVLLDRREPLSDVSAERLTYLHNQEDADGVSFFERKEMPYVYGGPEGLVTDELRLTGFQFVLAPGDLDYDWHPAPQRQVVLVLTGGLAMEYGDGTSSQVPPGGFLIGEDTNGHGHITRAVDGAPRLSVFAHLA